MSKDNKDETSQPIRFPEKVINENIQIVKNKADPQCMDYSKFVIVEGSEHYSLMPYASKQVYDLLCTHVGGINSVIDATAHIGVDTVNFITRFGASVIALENDRETYKCLVKNINTFSGDNTFGPNYAVYCNCIEFLKGFKQPTDIVYFDPPWGGPSYWKERNLMLFITHGEDKIPIYNVVNSVLSEGFTQTVVVKVPENFDYKTFKGEIIGSCKSYSVFKPRRKHQRKAYISYYLIICKI